MNTNETKMNSALPVRTSQRGLALLVALMVLVAMSLAGVALIRSVDTASLLAGNVAFRQGATLAADAGVEAARTFLTTASGNDLEKDKGTSGYYATSQDALDLTGNRTPDKDSDDVKWPGITGGIATPKCLGADKAGNTACFIIHRLCNATGPVNIYTCSTRASAPGDQGKSQGARQAEASYSPQGPKWGSGAPPLVYYRVTVRVAGPRNNIGFVQAFLII